MDSTSAGDRVEVATGGPPVAGIVFDTPSAKKTVVAVVEPGRGPVFRTLHPDKLSARTTDSTDDAALLRLIRRTPPPQHRAARNGSGVGSGRTGHTRGVAHRASDH